MQQRLFLLFALNPGTCDHLSDQFSALERVEAELPLTQLRTILSSELHTPRFFVGGGTGVADLGEDITSPPV